MKTLVYKRTHVGDPDESGTFGCNDCMGKVRAWPFEAVIGVGGLGDEPEKEGIAYRVTWIGIGPHKVTVDWTPYPLVTFDHFRLFDQNGEDFREVAKTLARRIYGKGIRATMTFTSSESKEIDQLLTAARRWPPSPALELPAAGRKRTCRPKQVSASW